MVAKRWLHKFHTHLKSDSRNFSRSVNCLLECKRFENLYINTFQFLIFNKPAGLSKNMFTWLFVINLFDVYLLLWAIGCWLMGYNCYIHFKLIFKIKCAKSEGVCILFKAVVSTHWWHLQTRRLLGARLTVLILNTTHRASVLHI